MGRRGLTDWMRRLLWAAGGRPEGVREAHLKALDSLPWREPYRARSFVALDCEMTGLDPERDEILSIGAVRIRESRVVLQERFYQVFKPNEAVSPKEVILIHGLGPEEVARGRPLPEALGALLDFLGDSVLVGHFTEVDLAFLNAALVKHRGEPLQLPALDTRLLYRWWWRRQPGAPPGPTDESLEATVAMLDLPRYPAHHAFYDALSAALLFVKLLEEFEAAGQVQFRALFKEMGVY
ncbi:MAG: 3'-5' exonuclease [Deltaproteobacteria bacterium]|nr:3'-5' exonuclease [Deltaproteobacteria bacterium]